jgi:hypothetical protein
MHPHAGADRGGGGGIGGSVLTANTQARSAGSWDVGHVTPRTHKHVSFNCKRSHSTHMPSLTRRH